MDQLDKAATGFDEWAIVEMLGHRQIAGHVREVQIAGAGFLRVDIPAGDGTTAATQYISPASVYAVHPVDEQTAQLVADNHDQAPMNIWSARRALAAAGFTISETPAELEAGDRDDEETI